MNAVEIEQAITDLAEQPFDAANFPYAFLEAFGNKATTIQRLRSGATNKSDLGGVLQTNHIHIATCQSGQVSNTLKALKASPATAKAKAKFILATDGADFEAEDLTSGDVVATNAKTTPRYIQFTLGCRADLSSGSIDFVGRTSATGSQKFSIFVAPSTTAFSSVSVSSTNGKIAITSPAEATAGSAITLSGTLQRVNRAIKQIARAC